jgi:hypothetical protein
MLVRLSLSYVTFTATVLASLVSFGPSVQAQNQNSYLFLGDWPYNASQGERLESVIGPAIKAGGFPFVVHYGDLKSGGSACGKDLIEDAYKRITNLWTEWGAKGPPPVFYTPGDNEWTDCDRPLKKGVKGEPKSELKRLALLRRIFFLDKPLILSKAWKYKRQPLYPENALWRSGSVQFGTVHLVGTNNGRIEILKDDVDMALAQVDARDEANRVWLKRIFSKARSFKSPASAVIIATQADVTNPDERAPCTPFNRMSCDAYAGFRAQLIKHAAAFKKPVLLVHGDTNPYCLDEKYGGAAASNLWRLNAGGDYHQPIDATVVTFRPGDAKTPFSVNGLVEGEQPAAGC